MKQNFTVLVGDANGADKAVQDYLASCHYKNVIVHSMEACRNNVGQWPVERHTAFSSKRDRKYYGVKDMAMAQSATCGFMLWDGKSKGTLANLINLLRSDKKTLLYLSPKKQFFKLLSFEDLSKVLRENGVADISSYLLSVGINPLEAGAPNLNVSGPM